MSDETKLLPCPHCGGDPVIRYGAYRWVACKDCHCQSPSKFEADEAIAAWNRRTPPAPCPTCAELTAEIDRHYRMAADVRMLLDNGGTLNPNRSQLQRADAILRELAGLPPAPRSTQEGDHA